MPNLFNKFPSIDSFAAVFKFMGRQFNPAPVAYGAKIKLHGTNGGVRITPSGVVTAQSRSRDLTPEDDNAGFCKWVDTHAEIWRDAALDYSDRETVTFFGEWAGKGIQKNDAVTKLDRKYFFLFSVQVGDTMYSDLTSFPEIENVLVLPWFEAPFDIDFGNISAVNSHIDRINEQVAKIGEIDPFIQETFDIVGQGEGLVLMPYIGTDRDTFSAMTFKAKSEAHRVNATTKAVSSRPEIPEGVVEFVSMFATEPRFEQGLIEACDGVADKPKTPLFLKWVNGDVFKESKLQLEELGEEYKTYAPHISKAAANWYIKKCQNMFSTTA